MARIICNVLFQVSEISRRGFQEIAGSNIFPTVQNKNYLSNENCESESSGNVDEKLDEHSLIKNEASTLLSDQFYGNRLASVSLFI